MKKSLIIAALSFYIPSAFAALDVQTEHETYGIKGSSVAELKQQMRKKGPRGYFAYTSWDIRFNYGYLRQNGSCSLDQVKVDLKTVYTMPEFKNYDDADNELKQKWDFFIKNLQTHEDGHAQNGLGAARDIDAMLTSLPAMNNCEALNQVANQKASAIIRQYNARDIQYDAQTEHGIKQGAVI